jgi:hypothetical protein
MRICDTFQSGPSRTNPTKTVCRSLAGRLRGGPPRSARRRPGCSAPATRRQPAAPDGHGLLGAEEVPEGSGGPPAGEGAHGMALDLELDAPRRRPARRARRRLPVPEGEVVQEPAEVTGCWPAAGAAREGETQAHEDGVADHGLHLPGLRHLVQRWPRARRAGRRRRGWADLPPGSRRRPARRPGRGDPGLVPGLLALRPDPGRDDEEVRAVASLDGLHFEGGRHDAIELRPPRPAPARRATSSRMERSSLSHTSSMSEPVKEVRRVTPTSLGPSRPTASRAARIMAEPPEAWTVSMSMPSSAAASTARATVWGMSWYLRSRKTVLVPSLSSRISAGPSRVKSCVPTL